MMTQTRSSQLKRMRVSRAVGLTVGLLCLIGASPSNAAAAVLYVSPTGSNTTGTGTSSNPWQTIGYATGQMAGGDTLLLQDGTYTGSANQIRPPSGRPTRRSATATGRRSLATSMPVS